MLEQTKIRDYFFYTAFFVVIIAGIKLASEIVVILLLAIFISSLLSAFLAYLTKKHIPKIVSYFLIIFIVLVLFFLLTYLINTTLINFINSLPQYEKKLSIFAIFFMDYLKKFGINVNLQEMLLFFDFNYFLGFAKNLLSNVSFIFSKLLLIVIGIAFILSEEKIFSQKLRIIFNNNKAKMSNFKLFSQNLQKYFVVKTFTSFLTGVLIYITLLFFNIEYAILWGFLAFLFNFIPVVGSIVAAIPALLISIVTGNFEATIYLAVIYVIINISISNMLEPKFMGSKLNLSPMIIFFSLIFWGWVLGIVGMFLAVPITMTIKIALESSANTKWVGILLSNITNKQESLKL